MTGIFRRIPVLGAAIAQLLGLAAGAAGVMLVTPTLGPQAARLAGLALHCAVALAATHRLGLPRWWLWIAVLFPLLVQLALSFQNSPAWPFGLAFLVLALFFSNTALGRVPLYLSNRQTVDALKALMAEKAATRFIDLGSGLGGVVRALDGDGRCARGVETAPMSWLIGWCLSRLQGRGEILRQDLWSTDLAQEDIVYAFLSPEPMPKLWEKAKREMKAGSHFVSNSFAVDGIDPDEVWELADRRGTRLFIYRMSAEHHLP
ncbi:hypothetical protein [Rhizobium sp. SSA_523]|uniref:hypothetical protein n=1 Tax=Rhizobium sp. SSA_523 TaxID=2952477 RepID=UPI0020918102|nr:hypothetical protein [Rhizobium sp. SSA_523]MCO5733882.1 hypothetical protein [Rhizobium sp. SSA_523]WKC24852.1 hypothetical protein QTJ18_12605 [Rhizobium sp. SSA_523]